MKKNSAQWIMCPPDYFGVNYEINPWMKGNIGHAHHDITMQQWQALYEIIAACSTVQLIPPVQGLPDMPFTANAGLIWGDIFVPTRFKFAERQGEEPYFLSWFRDQGYQIATLTEGVYFEGEGDALFQPNERLLWLGYGVRTDHAAHTKLNNILAVEAACLHLVNPHFYHLDTCFVPLPGKRALYYPPAFDAESLNKLRDYFPLEKRYEISEEDAKNFACNAILLDQTFVCNQASLALCEKLNSWGFEIITTPLSEFMLAGGAAKCLVLNTTNQP